MIDESSKINLNVLPFWDERINVRDEVLIALPGMTEDVADAILDWLDADDESRDFGVESDYYRSQSPAYEAKNGPLDSLDELLLIRGVTPESTRYFDCTRRVIKRAASSSVCISAVKVYADNERMTTVTNTTISTKPLRS